MKNNLSIIFILFLTGCGIDKESAPPQSSINNSGELDTSFFGTGYTAIDGSAGGSSQDDDIYGIAKDNQGRIIAVGSSHNGSHLDMAVWRLTASGALDTSFGSGGVFVHDSAASGNSTDVAYAVAIDSNDDIYITGTSFNGSDFDMVVWKVTSSGALDTTFNGTGVLVDDSAAGGSTHDQGTAIHIDGSGRILVAGFSDQTPTNRDVAVWRMSSAGVLDTGFDSDGIFTHDGAAGGEDDSANDIITDSSGNLYVVGRADSVGNLGDMAVWKLTDAGALDTTFNGTGFFTQNGAAGGSGTDTATAVVIDDEGQIFLTGFSGNSDGNNDMVIWSLLPTGALDTTFDADGMVIFDVSDVVGGFTEDTGEDIIVDSENRLVVSGTGNSDMCIWRFNNDGSIDEDFNTDGFFSHDSAAGGFGTDSGTSLVEDDFNHIYIGGFSEGSGGDYDASFWRLK